MDVVVILLGEDVVASGRAFARLREAADPGGLSTTVLDDPATTVADVIQAADALPFFGGQRFVGVRGLLQRLTRPGERGKGAAGARDQQLDELAGYLGRVPATTTLVFWEATAVTLPAALARAAQAAGEVRTFGVPSRPADLQPWLEGWLLDQARDQGVALTRDAASRLAATAVANIRAAESGEREQRVAAELLRLVNELTRLGTYAGPGVKVDGRVVAALAPDARAQVFDLVEAVAARATPRALRLLEQTLAEGAEPLVLLRLLDRQVSALLRADAAGSEAAIEASLKVPGWLARKYAQQARALGRAGLRRAHARVLAADLSIKTGQATGEAAVRDLVMALCLDGRRNGPAPAASA
jgi:DNA polymerase III delta subunit